MNTANKIYQTDSYNFIIITLFFLIPAVTVSWTDCSSAAVPAGSEAESILENKAYFHLLTDDKPSTLDPQKSVERIDQQLTQYLFDPLFTLRRGEPVAILIHSYQWLKPNTWEFTLKQGVQFHDGSELTTRDISATFNRAHRLQNDAFTKIRNYTLTVLDDYRFRIDTPTPNSELLWDLEDIRVIHRSAENASPEDFDNRKTLIGTGPYQLLHHQLLDSITLTAFPQYHRGNAFIGNLKITAKPNDQERLAAFLAGEADMVDRIPDKLLPLLRNAAQISSKTDHLLYLLSLDVSRDQSPDVSDLSGKPLQQNPLKDLRVRQAISQALNRAQLLQAIYGSNSGAQAAGQLVNNTTKIADPTLLPDEQNIENAKRLLAEAGYPDGFRIVLRDKHARHHWLQAIAAMLKEVGILATIHTQTTAEFFANVDKRSYSVAAFSYSTDGNLASMLKQLLYTNAETNTGGYSNPDFDKQLDFAISQTTSVLKQRALRKAQFMAISDLAVIPLWFTPSNRQCH